MENVNKVLHSKGFTTVKQISIFNSLKQNNKQKGKNMKKNTIKSIISNIKGTNIDGQFIRPIAHIWHHTNEIYELGIDNALIKCGKDIENAFSVWANNHVDVLNKFIPNIETKAYLVLVNTNKFAINIFGKKMLFLNIEL